MGTPVLNEMVADSETYKALGLYESSKESVSSGTPRALLLLASVLENLIEKNEKLLKASRRKDSITIFHGSRSPTLSIRQYIERIFKYSRCSTSCFVVAYIYIIKFLRTDVYLTSLNVHRLLITSIMVAAKVLDDGCLTSLFDFVFHYLIANWTRFLNVVVVRCQPGGFGVAYLRFSCTGSMVDGVLNSDYVKRISSSCELGSIREVIQLVAEARSCANWCYDNAYYARIGGVSKAEMNRMEIRFLFALDFRLHVTAEAFRNCCLKLENECDKYQNDKAKATYLSQRMAK